MSKLKTNIKTSHIPIILLTACTSIDEQIQGIKEGADAYIKKPFNMQHLVTRIESLLQNRQKLRERFQMNFPLSLDMAKGEDEGTKDNLFLEKLYELIADNLDNPNLEIDQLARTLYMNRTHFYQKVKALTNQTPFELLKTYRITKAAEILEQKGMAVKDAIAMTGFKSRTHFTKLFKDTYGTTPGKYAEQAMKKFEK